MRIKNKELTFLMTHARFAFLALLMITNYSFASMKPNFLLIMAEDMSSRVGAFGDSVANTPHLDALAQKGIIYTNVFTTAGVCSPSRAAHILSKHQISTGSQHMRTKAFKESKYRSVPQNHIKAYPEVLRANGYFTFVVNKLDYQFSDVFVKSGPFSIWDHEGSEIAWNKRDPGQPFFGFITFYETHESKLFPNYIKRVKTKFENYLKTNPNQVVVPPYYPDNAVIRNDIANHYNNISLMDGLVGDLLKRLESDGLANNTIIIWTTDHGDGLPRGKRELYDSGIKVPLILYVPEKYQNFDKTIKFDNRLISFLDIGPSILELAGIPIPSYMDGSPQLYNKNVKHRKFIYASKDRLDEFEFRERAVRDSRFKYIKNYMPNRPGATHLAYRDQMLLMQSLWKNHEAGKLNEIQSRWFDERPEHELYDIENDPYETKNLAYVNDYKEQLARMTAALSEWLSTTADMSDEPEIQMARKFWPNQKQPVTDMPTFRINNDKELILIPNHEFDSLGYKLNDDRWKLYIKPFKVSENDKVRAKAVRYGWAESDILEINN